MGQQLKRINPNEYKRFEEARRNNDDPQEYLNSVIDSFNPEKRKQWDNMISSFGKSR